jgi:hypothetical protein
MALQAPTKLTKKQIEAHAGLRLPAEVLQLLKVTRIHCNPEIALVHQHLAGRFVLRGEESGGAVNGVGAYCGYVDEGSKPLSWLQPIDTVGVNGSHALVIAPFLVRVQMVRVEHTYNLLITRHFLRIVTGRKKPSLESATLFRGRQGTLALDLWGKDASFRGRICPVFYSYAGEAVTIPSEYAQAVVTVTAAVSCVGCKHSHLLQPPTGNQVEEPAG